MFFSGRNLLYFAKIKTIDNFSRCYFVNINIPEERVHVFIPQTELSKLPNTTIFKRGNIDRYLERPSATFCNRKYSVWTIFVTQNFWHNYHLKINQIRPVNIPVKVIQKKKKQAKPLHIPTSYYILYHIMKSQKV